MLRTRYLAFTLLLWCFTCVVDGQQVARNKAALHQPEVLALPGPHYATKTLECGGQVVVFEETTDKEERRQLETGSVVWDGAVVLANYLMRLFAAQYHNESAKECDLTPLLFGALHNANNSNNNNMSRVMNVLELGAGTGVLSACLLRMFATRPVDAHVYVSDRSALLPQLQRTLRSNVPTLSSTSSPAYTVLAIDWTDPVKPLLPPLDLLIASDVLWLETLVAPFVETLCHYATAQTDILIAHQTRSHRLDRLIESLIAPHFDYHIVFSTREYASLRRTRHESHIHIWHLKRHRVTI